MKLTKAEQIKIVQAIPDSKLNELAMYLVDKKGSGIKLSGAGFWGDAWDWLKVNVGPIVSDIGKTVLNDILVPMLKQKIESKIAGKGLKLAGKGVRVAGGRAPKGSQEAKDRMAKIRALKKSK